MNNNEGVGEAATSIERESQRRQRSKKGGNAKPTCSTAFPPQETPMIVVDLLLELEPDIPFHSTTITSKISQYQEGRARHR